MALADDDRQKKGKSELKTCSRVPIGIRKTRMEVSPMICLTFESHLPYAYILTRDDH